MPAEYQIDRIPWDSAPAVNQVVTISHKKNSDSTWTIDSTTVQVKPNGDLVTPYIITGLDYNTAYNIKAANNCGAGEYIKNITTPANPCPKPVDIVGTTGLG